MEMKRRLYLILDVLNGALREDLSSPERSIVCSVASCTRHILRCSDLCISPGFRLNRFFIAASNVFCTTSSSTQVLCS